MWVSWRMDETSIKVKGQWYYLYRAVDKTGQTIDFLLTEHRDGLSRGSGISHAIRMRFPSGMASISWASNILC